MATTRTSLDDTRPSRLPTPRNSISIDPMAPTSASTAIHIRDAIRARSPNATPMPGYPSPRLPSSIPSFTTRRASGPLVPTPPNRTNSSGSTTSPVVASKLSTIAPSVASKSPRPTVSRTAQGQSQPDKSGDAPRKRTTSGTSMESTRSRPAANANQPRPRVLSQASQANKSATKARREPPVSPAKKLVSLPQPDSPIQSSPVKSKPRLGGTMQKTNSSPPTVPTPSRPPRQVPGSRQTSNVFPPLNLPSPSRSERNLAQKLPAVVWPANDKESTNGSLEEDWTPSVHPMASRPMSEVYGIPLGSEGLPQFRAEDDEMTMELITEVDDGGELDEDVSVSFG
jgi:hypothetical protein